MKKLALVLTVLAFSAIVGYAGTIKLLNSQNTNDFLAKPVAPADAYDRKPGFQVTPIVGGTKDWPVEDLPVGECPEEERNLRAALAAQKSVNDQLKKAKKGSAQEKSLLAAKPRYEQAVKRAILELEACKKKKNDGGSGGSGESGSSASGAPARIAPAATR